MTISTKLNLLSWLGARSAHRLLSFAFRQPFFDHLNAKLPQDVLEKAVENARYYMWANLMRSAIYLPVLVGLRGSGHVVSIALVVSLVVFHWLCVGAEAYKGNSARLLLGQKGFAPALPAEPVRQQFDEGAYFAPKRFETERAYRSVGFEGIRTLVNLFIEYTQLSAADRRLGRKPSQMAPTRTGMIRYEADTRQAERMHLIAGALNLPPLASFVLLAKWRFAAWVAFIVLIDAALVLLQRYLRVRVVGRIRAIDSKRQARIAS